MDLEPKSELVALLSGVRRLPLKEAKILSEEHRVVHLVVIGRRRKKEVSKARVGEILGLEVSSILDDLLSPGVDLLRPVECHAESPQSVVRGCSAQGSPVEPGEKEP